MEVWINKYAPKNSTEVIGQNKAIENLLYFVKEFKKQKRKGALLYGEPGTGKTSSVYAIAQELDLEVLELNASDFRKKDAINSLLGNAINQMSLFSKGKIILVDEVDGLSGTKDRGAIPAVVSLIKKTSFPIIMTLRNPWDKKFSPLRKACETIEFHTMNYVSILNILKKISIQEEIKFEETALKTLARRAGGDTRAAINDYQMMAGVSKKFEKDDIDIIGDRKKVESIHQALMKVFKTTDPNMAMGAFDNVDEDFDQIMLWMDENLPKEYTKPEDLIRAYDKLSRADVFKGRIRRRQHWRFIVYIFALLSAGVAVSKDEKYKNFIKYEQTKRILMLWQAKMKYGKRIAISEKIAEKIHTSKKRVIQDVYPFIKENFKQNKEFAKEFTEEFELSKDEITYLKK